MEAYTKGYDLVKEMADTDSEDGAKAKVLAVALALNGAQVLPPRGSNISVYTHIHRHIHIHIHIYIYKHTYI